MYYNSLEKTQLYKCLFNAIFNHFWCFIDFFNLILILLLCYDQFVSIVWTKTHDKV